MGRFKERLQQKLDTSSSSTSERENESISWYRRWWKADGGLQSPRSTQLATSRDLNEKRLSLWDRAYNLLKTKDGLLVEKYEKLLSEELSIDGQKDNFLSLL